MNKKLLDSFFIMQVILAVIFGTNQFVHMLNTSTVGLSTSMFLCTFIFVSINLHLAIGSYYDNPSRMTLQTIVIYVVGTAIYGSLTVLMLFKSKDIWGSSDTITSSISISLIIISIIYTKINNIKLFDPIMKGIYGVILRVIPQIALALKIFQDGGSGLGVVMVVIFHI
ncbi:MAG: hypothetical protein WCI91_04080, partial [Candidatus Nomurabacteria bacterium]